MLELYRLVRRERLIHLNSSKVGVLGLLAGFAGRVPVRIFTVHGWAFFRFTGLASALFRRLARLIRVRGTP